MDRPTAQQSFSLHTGLFHHAGRRHIIDITHGPDAVNRRLFEGGSDEPFDRLGHVSSAPILPRQNIPEFPLVAIDSGVDHAEELAVPFAHQCPMIGIALLPHQQARPDERASLVDFFVRQPG